MLINALCDYYDILATNGKVLPDGYSNVNIHYLIALTSEGRIDGIINYQNREVSQKGKGKVKEKWTPKEVVMPKRTEKTGIDSNIVEHRPLYIFGLNLDDNGLNPEDRTGKAKKSHEAFVKANLEFLENMDSPVINAYRNFLLSWKPEEEKENVHLLGLGKDYGKSGFAFCLTGFPDLLLNDDEQIKQKWEQVYMSLAGDDTNEYISQCAVSGKEATIARIHNKIRGVYGSLAIGSVLVGFNNDSEKSYGKDQSFNSNISQGIMKKYTEALNYLLKSSKHKMLLDDITIVFWAMNPNETCEERLMAMLYGQSEKIDADQTEQMLKDLLESGKKGKVTEERLHTLDSIDPDVDFYMLGLKPNSSRLSVKFIYRKRFAEILWNIARFQKDLQVAKEIHPVSIARIKSELLSPKSSSEKINPALLSKLIEAVIHGTAYPVSLLETIVRRVKTDGDNSINKVRAGIIKACENRNYKKEEFGVALDKENYGQAYLCGRLFAVLEKLQQEASNNSLNRTIKDSYFAAASSKPAAVFPKLVVLAQNHMKKVKSPVFYNKLIGEIIGHLKGEFPETLLLQDQGRFIIGYYQQYQSFFEKNDKINNSETEEI